MKKNVYMVSPRYLPIVGGAEVQCSRLVRELRNEFSNEVEVKKLVTRRVTRSLKRNESVDKLSVKRIGFSGIGMFTEYFFCLELFFYLLFNFRKFDILHCHATGVFGLTCSLFGYIFKKKVLLKISTNGELNSLSNFKHKLSTLLLKKSTLIALNKEGLLEAESNFPLVKKVIIPNGIESIDISCFDSKSIRSGLHMKYGDDVKIFVFVGRFVERKGIKLIDEIAKGNFLDENNIVFLLIGDDSYQRDSFTFSSSNKRLCRLGLKKNVFPYIVASDCFFSPSLYEGLPNTVLEALSVNKYCILSDIEPHKELKADNMDMICLFNGDSLDEVKSLLVRLDIKKLPSLEINKKYNINSVASSYVNLYLN